MSGQNQNNNTRDQKTNSLVNINRQHQLTDSSSNQHDWVKSFILWLAGCRVDTLPRVVLPVVKLSQMNAQSFETNLGRGLHASRWCILYYCTGLMLDTSKCIQTQHQEVYIMKLLQLITFYPALRPTLIQWYIIPMLPKSCALDETFLKFQWSNQGLMSWSNRPIGSFL